MTTRRGLFGTVLLGLAAAAAPAAADPVQEMLGQFLGGGSRDDGRDHRDHDQGRRRREAERQRWEWERRRRWEEEQRRREAERRRRWRHARRRHDRDE